MKRGYYSLLLAIFFLISSYLKAEIIECSHFAELLSFITPKSSLFLEVDNVILKPREEVAKTIFFNHLKQELLLKGFNPDQIASQLYPLWEKVQKKATTELSDVHLKEYFKSLNDSEVKIWLLSHRGPPLAYRTLDQLHEHGLFLESAQSEFNHYEIEKNLALVYENMILLHPLCNKGEFLAKYLQRLPMQPCKVICVDHELIHLVHIQQEMEKLNIPYLGIYLRDADSNVTEYTKLIGQIQLEYIDQLLSDSTAKAILGEKIANY